MNDWNKDIQKNKWEKNKYSIYADLGLGALFFIAGKITEDLIFASLVGVAGGLALLVLQRFVKIDLLGGFAVFGTIMLFISGLFSFVLQDDYDEALHQVNNVQIELRSKPPSSIHHLRKILMLTVNQALSLSFAPSNRLGKRRRRYLR